MDYAPKRVVQMVVDVRNREMKKDQNRFVYLSLDDFRYEEDRMDKDAITVRKRNKSNKHLYWWSKGRNPDFKVTPSVFILCVIVVVGDDIRLALEAIVWVLPLTDR